MTASSSVQVFTNATDEARRDALLERGVTLSPYISLRHVLESLYEEGVGRLLVEAGPTLVTSLLDGDFVDEWVVTVATRVRWEGGLYRSEQAGPLDNIGRFHIHDVTTVGTDVKLVLRKGDV